MGRPTKLTPAVARRICALVARGNFARVAAGAAGVSKRTFNEWLARGDTEPESIYGRFARDVVAARAQAERRLVGIVFTGSAARRPSANWKAAAWLLEKLFPLRWGDRPLARLQREKLQREIDVLEAKATGLAPPDVTVTLTDPAAVDELFRRHFGYEGCRGLPEAHDAATEGGVRDMGEAAVHVPADLDRRDR